MTPIKWYEEIYLTVQFSPFCWKLRADFSRTWRTASLNIGPFAFYTGWPDLLNCTTTGP